jgi:glycerol-3-phosphate acyltransferase PlsY
MNILLTIVFIIIGYLIGSIPFSLIIGKTFFNTDIREKGSGNLGGTNAGRTLGKKAGVSVMLLDIFKAYLVVMIVMIINSHTTFNINPYIIGFATIIGHCYPIFAGFKGGKGVACAAGFILALNPILLVIALILVAINLKIHHMMSLAVIITVGILVVISFIFKEFSNIKYIAVLLFIFITFQHRSNIKKIMNGTENKVSWI